MLHSPLLNNLQDQDLISELIAAKQAGDIRYIGASFDNPDDAWSALECGVFELLQFPVNPYSGTRVIDLIEACRRQGVGIMSNQPFSSGKLLQDKVVSDFCRAWPGLSSTELGLQFLMDLPADFAILIGMTNRQHLQDNLKAVERMPVLSPEDMRRFVMTMNKASAQ